MSNLEKVVQYAKELLDAAIQSAEWPMRFAAAEALIDTGDERGVDVLGEGLSSQEAFLRDRAVVALGKSKRSDCGDWFLQALSDRDIHVRGHALEALALADHPLALEKITEALRDRNDFVKECAVVALSLLQEKGASELEAVALAHGYECIYPIRLSAAFYLAKNGNAVGFQVLSEALDCEDEWVAFLAAKNLAALDDRRGLPQLREMLAQGGWPEKLAALEGILKLGEKEIAGMLYRPSEIPDLATRLEATRLLDPFCPEKTSEILAENLEHPDDAVRMRVLELIGEIGRPELLDLAEDIFIQGPEHLRAAAVMAVEKVGRFSAIPHLVPVLERSYWLLRLQTARIVLKLAYKERWLS